MTKLEINNKLAELYPEIANSILEASIKLPKGYLLIDDSGRIFDLAIKYKIGTVPMLHIFLAGNTGVEIKENYSDHESPQAAARYAIALALIKLAESK